MNTKRLSNKAIVKGVGEVCYKCSDKMERRTHPNHWVSKKMYFYTEWDFCPNCKHVQHYEKFKNSEWKKLSTAFL